MSTPFTAPDRTASADQTRWFDNHVRPHESAFRADEPETFVELLKTRPGIEVQPTGNVWVIRASR